MMKFFVFPQIVGLMYCDNSAETIQGRKLISDSKKLTLKAVLYHNCVECQLSNFEYCKLNNQIGTTDQSSGFSLNCQSRTDCFS